MKPDPKSAVLRQKPFRSQPPGTMAGPTGNSSVFVLVTWLVMACCWLAPSSAGAQTLAAALDATNLVWTTGGMPGGVANWFGQTATNRDGVDAAQSGYISNNQTNWIETTVTNGGFVTFWWKTESRYQHKVRFAINGIERINYSAGLYDANWYQQAFDVPAGTNTLRWSYTKDANSPLGKDAGWVCEVQFTPGLSLVGALSSTSFVWTTGGNLCWFPQTGTIRDDPVTAQAGAIANNQQSWLSTTVSGPGVLQFWWKVSASATNDPLEFRRDDLVQASISGEVDWTQRTEYVPAGTHTLQWRYARKAIGGGGLNTAWLDAVDFFIPAVPFIGVQPTNQTAWVGQRPQFTVEAISTETPTYQWRFNNTDIPGATNAVLILPPVQLTNAGAYSVVASNSHNVTVSSVAILTVRLDALDSPAFVWANGGAAPWFMQTNVTHDGVSAARSGAITNSEQSWLETSLTLTNPVWLDFWWTVSTEWSGGDRLSFELDGAGWTNLYGQMAPWWWNAVSVPLRTGAHTLRWVYAKDSSGFGGDDAGWLDQVTFTPVFAPVFLTSPQGSIVLSGTSVTLTSDALGTEPLSYQWFHDGVPVVNGAGATLPLSSAQTNDAGSYWVVVTNFSGRAQSVSATVTVVAPESLAPAGLVGWWPGDGDPQDLVAGNHGAGQGGVFYSAAQVGQGFTFNSDDDRVVISHRTPFNPVSPGFSLHFWVKGGQSQPQSICALVEKSHGFSDNTGWAFQAVAASGLVAINIGDGSSSWPGVQSTNDVLDNQWHHVAGVWDGTAVRLYVDAVPQGTSALTGPANNTRAVNLGFAWGGGTAQRFFRGQIDEVAIYNRALSSTELASLWAAGSNGPCKSAIPPVLLAQPSSTNVLEGRTVGFNATAGGSAPLRYQWLKNSVALTNGGYISGVNTSTLTLAGVQAKDSGSYQLAVTNSFRAVTSSVATLSVEVPLTLAEALDASNLSWSVGGTPASVAMWYGQRTNTHDLADAAQSGVLTNNQTNRFQTTVMGPGSIAFWWKVGSEPKYDRLSFSVGGVEQTNISGNVSWRHESFDVPAGAQALRWEYGKNVSGTVQPDAGWVDDVRFTPGPPPMALAVALDTTNLAWTTAGDDRWFGQTNVTHDRVDALQSGEIGDNGETSAHTAVGGPGILRYWWKVSSEYDYDWLHFWIDGTREVGISGDYDWEEEVFALPSGTSVLTWTYSRDGSSWDGADAGWLDEVRFTPTEKPLIGRPPQPQTTMSGDLAEFEVLVAGVEPLRYQWYHNEAALPGETNASLRLQPVHAVAAGDYAVIVTNDFGSATSAPPAALTLLPMELQWQRGLGGSDRDVAFSVLQTADGFLVGGWSDSTNGNRMGTNFGMEDFWAVRIGSGGDLVWERSFGGTNADYLRAVTQTSDGGFLLAGSSYSGADGNKTSANFGGSDFWIVRTDAAGHKLWDRAYGGTGNDDLWRVKALPDGGFALAGSSSSSIDGNKTGTNYGASDFWLVRVDAKGDKLWDRAFGGAGSEELRGLDLVADGGFLLAGASGSPPDANKTSPHFGHDDFWLVRVNTNGNKVWESSFGGSDSDFPIAVQSTTDGGWVIGGGSTSATNGCKSSPAFGGEDFWLVRVNANGVKMWDQSFGGSGAEYVSAINQTAEGGFLVAGVSASSAEGAKTRPGFGGDDVWLACLDGNGQVLWDYTFGGSDDDWPNAMQATPDGGFILAGGSWSDPDGNKTTDWLGAFDTWLIKLRPYSGVPEFTLISPARTGADLSFWFQSQTNLGYTVECNSDLRTTNWLFHHTVTGDGSLMRCLLPMTNTAPQFFRVQALR